MGMLASRLSGGVKSLTPIPDAQCLLVARIEHGADDHEASGYRAFAHAEYEPNNEETCEILARSMT